MDITQTTLRNLALGKAATQSSISAWSMGATPEEDARVAVNGDTASPAHFHTADEQAAWWQVDLGADCAIDRLRLFNRREVPERLRRFTVLVALSDPPEDWRAVHRKTDDLVFGGQDDLPLEIALEGRCLARFIRIRRDEPGVLHFRECEVLGDMPGLEEAAMLRQQHRAVIEAAEAAEAAVDQRLIDGRTGFISRIDSRKIFIDTEKYSPTLVNVLRQEYYEGPERQIAKASLRPGDRVLEIGTAIGVVSMAAASIVGPAQVVTYDANPAINADARRNFTANGMAAIKAEVGVMRNQARWSEAETNIPFFVSRDFWASRLFARESDADIVKVVQVPLVCLERKLAEHQANVLICDIEGGEADLLDGANLHGVRLIMMEIHYWAVGRQRIDEMIRYLITAGFNVNFSLSRDNIVTLERDQPA